MRKHLFFTFLGVILLGTSLKSQTSYTIYDEIVFYDGYAGTVDEPVPSGVTRINNATYTTKLSNTLVQNLSAGALTMDVKIGALCDNYDRLGHIYLAFVPKGATTYTQSEVDRIEIARIITPFMNKNINPTEVPYHFTLDNVSEIFNDTSLLSQFDIWVELEVFGVPYAAQTQVAGCSGRIDVFKGTLIFNVDEGTETYTHSNFILPLSVRKDLNNYNATDVPGETTRIINFTLDAPIENAVLYLITSNHGANAGGEEYERRRHYLYLDDELVYEYIPGGKSCEPWRQFNTQGNGIYGATVKTTRQWLDFNNWCPGDVIPNREVNLGNLAAGNHTIKLDVPDAVFVNGEGYFPISMYIQNRKSGQVFCLDPTNLVITEQVGDTVSFDWTENGDATEWEIMYGRRFAYNQEIIMDDLDGETGFEITDLTNQWYYEVYVRSVCDENFTSNWVGPVATNRILSTTENNLSALSVYPNPTKDFVNIDSKSPIKNVVVFNQEGKKIIESKSSKIDLKKYPTGIYVVAVTLENGKTVTNKIVKQ
ncbi:peptide-N-glycosidase F-related protein [Moheibacter sediminis]|uniref:Por secretion system C-terminal sorting domain-containing protein n=1 Tax=Moheibacter sediminis TaxID=1434700 RepID=A0A1W1YMZ1_9FLAO|nr:peptide-N-glycosidase F-related protein [Moheibacter sediminis]SMC37514.1 Por secretion system C-terminal sorting domain-containing protein [Moheibacter sediminis]